MENIILEFERVTKYPLVKYLTKFREFLLNSYPDIERYFSGDSESVNNEHLITLRELTEESKDVLAQFKNFANKFDKCGYWELMDYIDDLNNTIEKINKLPKFFRTSLTKRGYKPFIQVDSSVGGFRTLEDVAELVKERNEDNTDWMTIAKANDLNESDWEIDELTPITLYVNNRVDVVVTTILDMPIGKRVYGRDIKRKLTFKDNDLETVEYQNNIEQKCDILLGLNRGDVPENKLFGKNLNLFSGTTASQFAYPELINDIQNTFMQNDLFEYIEVTDWNLIEGDMNITVEIKTKYDYKTEKKVTI